METRTIELIDNYGCYILVDTDAPKEEIENAISYRNDKLANHELEDVSEFEIIQKYLEDKGYGFTEQEDVLEEYYW